MSSAQPHEKTLEEIEREASKYPILTFADILRALRDHPEWLQELRKLILTEELIELPRKFDELLKRVEKIEKDVDTLKKDVEVLKQDVAVLKQDVAVLKQDVAILKQDVAVLKQDVAVLKQDVAVLKQDVAVLKKDMAYLKGEVGRLKGREFERTIRERYFAYFGNVLKRSKMIDLASLLPLIEELEERGVISERQRESVLFVDLVIEGIMRRTGKEVALAVEISYSIYEDDLVRAQERAGILAHVLKKEVIPTIGGVEIGEDLERKADEEGVLVIRVKD